MVFFLFPLSRYSRISSSIEDVRQAVIDLNVQAAEDAAGGEDGDPGGSQPAAGGAAGPAAAAGQRWALQRHPHHQVRGCGRTPRRRAPAGEGAGASAPAGAAAPAGQPETAAHSTKPEQGPWGGEAEQLQELRNQRNHGPELPEFRNLR